MALLPRSFGGRVWFRLTDVPLDKRQKAADQLLDQLAKQPRDATSALADFHLRTQEAAQIEKAAENPSDIVRFVSAEAWVKVMGSLP